MNKYKFIILSCLEDNNCTTELHSMSIYDVQDELTDESGVALLQRVALQKNFKYLIDNGYVKHGLRDCRRVTYYITEQGKEILEKYRKGE